MANEYCMNCFSVKGQFEVCPYCGYADGTPPEQPHYLTPGTVLNKHFIVGTVIGFGGFGITYKCFDTTLGVTVAVKEFYPIGLVNRSPGQSKVGLLPGEKQEQFKEQLNRFLMEARSVAQFGKAKDIVNIYDYFEENGTAYIIMEHIEGVLLKDYLDSQGAIDPNVAMAIIIPIIEAAKKIHSKGIIHRDLSPDNIFLIDENTIKVFDFGAAQLNDSKEGMAGEKVIKVGYSAPEQYRDKSKQDFYTDIYSIGAIMYQMLTGLKPMESTEREHKDTLKSPMQLGVSLNSNVDRAVMEALAVRPSLRFQGIQQFEDALRSKRVAEYPKEKLKKQKRRRNGIISLAVLLVLAVGIGIGVVYQSNKNNVIFGKDLTADTEITIWVENNSQKNQIEELVVEGYKKAPQNFEGAEGSEKWNHFWDNNYQYVKKVNVVVKKDMQEAIEKAKKEELPNMYITDHVTKECKKNLISLEDSVFSALNLDDYGYLNQYEDYNYGYQELPTGLDTLIAYGCEIDYNKYNTLISADIVPSDVADGEIATKELYELISGDEKLYNDIDDATGIEHVSNKLATFYGNANVNCLFLEDGEEWKKYFEGELDTGENPDLKSLENIQKFNSVARKKNYRLSDGNLRESTSTTWDDEPCGSVIVAGTGYKSQLSGLDNSIKRKNPVKKYSAYVVTHEIDGEKYMLVEYAERFGITKKSDENQRLACEKLLFVMMQDINQSKKYSDKEETTLPIRLENLEELEQYNAKFASFYKLYEQKTPCIIIGEISGDVDAFAEQIASNEKKKDGEKETIQKLCDSFRVTTDEEE